MAKVRARTFISTFTVRKALWIACLVHAGQACTEPTFRDGGGDSGVLEAGSNPTLSQSESDAETATPALDASNAAESDAGSTQAGDVGDGAASLGDDASLDAAPLSDADSDADATPDAAQTDSLPAWATPLLGTFAKRSVTFSYDDGTDPAFNTRNIEHAIVKITQQGGELRFASQMCSYVVSLKNPQGSPPVTFKNASSMPVLQGRIFLGAPNTFSSELMPQHLGFDPDRGTSCDAAGRRSKFDDQTWIAGANCQCYPTSVPEHMDDCRVIDGDGDALAGITMHGPSPLGTTVTDYVMVFDYSLRIVDGQISGNLPPQWDEVRAQVPSCINPTGDGCSVGYNELCPGGSTLLLRLSEQATCADLDMGDFGPADPFPAEVDCRAKLGT